MSGQPESSFTPEFLDEVKNSITSKEQLVKEEMLEKLNGLIKKRLKLLDATGIDRGELRDVLETDLEGVLKNVFNNLPQHAYKIIELKRELATFIMNHYIANVSDKFV